MNIMIFCDMEGIGGVFRKSQVTLNESGYQEARSYMTQEINTCVNACFDSGVRNVVVRDVHAGCNNIIWEAIDKRIEYMIAGNPGKKRFEGIEKFDGLILLGYHAMAGTSRAILAHTASLTWQNCLLNGKKIGEFALDAIRAGKYNIPVIMTSGDDKLCTEAKSFIRNVVTVKVKDGLSWESGKLLPLERVNKKIYNGTVMALRKHSNIKPFKVQGNVTLRVEFIMEVPLALMRKDINFIDGKTCEATGPDVENLINSFIY